MSLWCRRLFQLVGVPAMARNKARSKRRSPKWDGGWSPGDAAVIRAAVFGGWQTNEVVRARVIADLANVAAGGGKAAVRAGELLAWIQRKGGA